MIRNKTKFQRVLLIRGFAVDIGGFGLDISDSRSYIGEKVGYIGESHFLNDSPQLHADCRLSQS